MTQTDNKQFIKQVFKDTFENMDASEENYSHYFAKEYVQHVDGKTLNYTEFLAHMKALKQAMKTIAIDFKIILADGDKVATVHKVHGIKRDGGTIHAQVNAIFQIKDNQIILCDELTHLIQGNSDDKDLGSRH
tara:strand:- start:1938 stop:2336 length:399 start_codon:yes stop_codon:yes gene_type:complete